MKNLEQNQKKKQSTKYKNYSLKENFITKAELLTNQDLIKQLTNPSSPLGLTVIKKLTKFKQGQIYYYFKLDRELSQVRDNTFIELLEEYIKTKNIYIEKLPNIKEAFFDEVPSNAQPNINEFLIHLINNQLTKQIQVAHSEENINEILHVLNTYNDLSYLLSLVKSRYSKILTKYFKV